MGANASQITSSATDIDQAIARLQVIQDQEQPSNKVIPKSQSSYAHFSDYSMFPDRFNNVPKNTPIIIEPIDAEQRNELDPRRFHRSQSENPSTGSLPGNPGILSKYGFRLRSSSATEQQIQLDSSSLTEDSNPPNTPSSGASLDERPGRSSSHSRMYKFDFGTIHEKEGGSTANLDAAISIPMTKSMHNETTVHGTSVPAPDSMEALAYRAKRVRKTSEPRYGFFDYSMIPDKDPKCFKK